jgi:hypothetical protein
MLLVNLGFNLSKTAREWRSGARQTIRDWPGGTEIATKPPRLLWARFSRAQIPRVDGQ